MDLKDFLGVKDRKTKDLYWAIVLEPGWIQAGIWEITENKAEVISVSPVTPWETDSEIVGASDAALSSAVQLLPEGIGEPSKTVFGVPPFWVDKGQIKEEYLSKIKNICTELSLEPSGFVVLSEAIAHLIKIEEGSPANAIIAGFGKDFLEISVFKLGNLVGTTQVSRSVSFFDDVKEGLSRFSLTESLPSRIVIYDGKEGDLEDVKEALTAGNWESPNGPRFLHTPKIEIFSPDKKVSAVALAGAAEIAGVVGIVEKSKEPFEEEKISSDHQNVVTPQKSLSPEELGFVVGEDIAQKPVYNSIQEHSTVNHGDELNTDMSSSEGRHKTNKFESIMKKVGAFFSGVSKKVAIPAPKISGKKNFVLLGSILGGFVVAFLLFWILYPKAQIKIYVSPKRFEEKVETTVLKNSGSTNIGSKIIAGRVASVDVSGEKTKSTTGIKKVGDKAKGSVNIQNGTSSILKLTEGTLLTAANNLTFSLVNSASISAALSPSNPGTYVVEVTAGDIGAEYNLAKNEVFSVGTYSKSEVDGVAVSDFSGGSSRDISAVSLDDANSLLSSLTSELSNNAKKELINSIPADQFLIEDSLVATASSKVFSSKVGDEASDLKLSLGLKSSAIYVSRKDLTDLSQSVLSGAVPSGFSLDPGNIDFVFSRIKDVSAASLFNLTVKADFLPKEDTNSLAKAVSGKSIPAAEEVFSKIPGFVTAEIGGNLKLPWIFGYLPRLSRNITIEILGER
jgi:hypothetical protein